MIALEDITVRFGGVLALDRVSAAFTAPVNGIIGPNGAGKTTAMNVISGFLRSTGRIACDGVDIATLPAHKRARWGLRRSFQREQIANDLTVRDNLRAMVDSLPGSRTEKEADIDRALETTGLAGKSDELAGSLNMFQRRLADLARCLVGRPRIVMLDEPAGGLAADETERLGALVEQIHALTGAITLVIDHDVDLIGRICAETLVLDFGRRIAFGQTAAVLADPKVQAAYLGIGEVD